MEERSHTWGAVRAATRASGIPLKPFTLSWSIAATGETVNAPWQTQCQQRQSSSQGQSFLSGSAGLACRQQEHFGALATSPREDSTPRHLIGQIRRA